MDRDGLCRGHRRRTADQESLSLRHATEGCRRDRVIGIAKAANETHGITLTNMTVGSVAYAAPEQLTGKKLDGRADQYALSCTTFHLLTGQQPFVNSNPAVVIGSHLSSSPPRLGSVREDLDSMDSVLGKAMAKEPIQGFETCRDFASALDGDSVWSSSVVETQFAPVAASPPLDASGAKPQTSRNEATGVSTDRRAAMIAIGVAALLAVLVFAFIGARLAQQPSQPSPPPTARRRSARRIPARPIAVPSVCGCPQRSRRPD